MYQASLNSLFFLRKIWYNGVYVMYKEISNYLYLLVKVCTDPYFSLFVSQSLAEV